MGGMRPFSRTELRRMQGTQQGAMQDECQVLTYRETGRDSRNMPVFDHILGGTFQCGLDMVTGSMPREVMLGGEVVLLDARLRLPLEAEDDIHPTDWVKITKRFGETLDEPLLYEVIGETMRGPSGLQLNLRLVTEE